MVRLLDECDTGLNADTVACCDLDPYTRFFVCGTYQLIEGELADRTGSLILYHCDINVIKKIQEVREKGILQVKWSPNFVSGKILLAAVTSIGELIIFQFSNERLTEICRYNFKLLVDEGTRDFMLLAVDWCQNRLCVSDNKGGLSVVTFEGQIKIENRWKGHDNEVWTTVFSTDPTYMLSGGDDGKMHVWDLRVSKSVGGYSTSYSGITAIAPNFLRENLIATGGYDEKLSLWDSRQWKKPYSVTPAKGGLWRLKWEKLEGKLLLAASMYGGFQVFQTESVTEPNIVDEFMDHKSLAYGADWFAVSSDYLKSHFKDFQELKKLYLTSTCSFYDNKLCLCLWDFLIK